MKTHYWSIGPADFILCQNHLSLFALRTANLSQLGWQAIIAEIKSWCAARCKIVEMRVGSGGDSITLNVARNVNPDAVMQELREYLEQALPMAA